MAQLTGKTIIITGSSRGVGADTAQILAAEGANVVVNYRSKAPRAAKIVTSIEEAGGKQSPCRLTSPTPPTCRTWCRRR